MIAVTMPRSGFSTLVEAARGSAERAAVPPAGKKPMAPPRWLVARRQAALQRFLERGVPTTNDEAWRFTDIGRVAALPYLPLPVATSVTRANIGRLIPDFAGPMRAFTPGMHDPGLATPPDQKGVTFTSISDVLRGDDTDLERRWTRAPTSANPFMDLNEALAMDGAFIDVAPGTIVDGPLHIAHVGPSGDSTPHSGHPRHFIRIGKGAQVTIVQSFASLGEGPHLANPVTLMDVGDGARVEHVQLNLESRHAHHIGIVDAVVGRDANLLDHSFTFGGALVRNDIDVRFAAPGGEATLNGLYLVGDSQHVDHHTFVDHAVAHCTSNEFYKGILDDASRGVFFGKVLIRKDAQKSNAAQSNKNLLLSDGALADSTPALEIFADDVKAAHGSTIGQLDKDHLFYLRARGLDAATARSLLTYAFARDIVARVQEGRVRGALEEILFSRLPQGDIVREVLR